MECCSNCQITAIIRERSFPSSRVNVAHRNQFTVSFSENVVPITDVNSDSWKPGSLSGFSSFLLCWLPLTSRCPQDFLVDLQSPLLPLGFRNLSESTIFLFYFLILFYEAECHYVSLAGLELTVSRLTLNSQRLLALPLECWG